MSTNAQLIKLMLQEQERACKNDNKYKAQPTNEYEELCKIKEKGKMKARKESVEIYNLKKSLLSECIYTVFDKALGFQLESQNKDTLKRSLVNNFIEEQGLDRLLNEFKTKSYLLSEFARIINETVNSVLEKCKEEQREEIDIDSELRSDFYEQLDTDDVDEIANIIKKRTSMATEEFIQANMNDRLEIQDILRTTQEKVDAARKDVVKEGYERRAKAAIAKVRNRNNKGIFESMVFNISKATLKDPEMKAMYMTENSLDLDSIVENVSIMYTFLETVNTTKMIKVDEKYITKMLNGLKG